MNNLKRKNKGITILIIISSLLIYNATNGIEMRNLKMMYNESVSIKPLISINLTLTYENQKLSVNELPNLKEVTSENVPIPKGFYYVGGTKDEGVVISDIEGDDLDNSKQGNQFVRKI